MPDPWQQLDQSRGGGGGGSKSPSSSQAGVFGGDAGLPYASSPSASSDPWAQLDQHRGGTSPQSNSAAVTGKSGGGGLGGFFAKVGHGIAHQAGEGLHIVTSIPSGLGHLAEHLAGSTYNAARVFAQPVVAAPSYLKVQPGEGLAHFITRDFPILSDVAQPTVNVARDIGGAGEAGLHLAHLDRGHAGLEHEAATAWSQHPLGRLIGDALGASVVLGPIDSLVGKAGFGDTAAGSALGKAAAVSHAVAAAPLLPFKGLSMLPRLAGNAADEAVNRAAAAGEKAPLTARMVQPLSDAFRGLARTNREGNVAKQGDLRAVERTAAEAQKVAPDIGSQRVAAEVAQGTAPAFAQARQAAVQAGRPDLFDEYVQQRFRGTLTPEEAHTLADIGSGGNPEALAQANAYLAALDKGVGSRGVGSAAALSDRYQAAHPEQAGFAPIGEGDPNEITAAPSRLRPLLGENRAAQQFADELGGGHQTGLPQTLADLERAGQDARYLPHMQEGRPAAGTFQPSDSSALPKLRTITADKLRTGSPVYDRSLKGVTRGLSEQTAKQADLRTIEAVTKLPQVVRLNEGALEGVQTAGDAAARGYVVWSPKAWMDTGQLRALTDEQIAAGEKSSQYLMPKAMFDRFRNYIEPRRPGPIGEGFDKATRAFYKTTLHGTPYFAKMYALQNAGLALTRGDVGIAEMIRLAPKAIEAIRTGEFPELQGRLPIGDETTASQGKLQPLRKAGRAVTGGLPRVIDGFSRTLVALSKIEKGATPEDAILEANRTMGMYNSESAAGRAMIRRVFPIVPWAEHVLKAMGEFAGDHPVKALFLANLGVAASQDEELRGVPAFQHGLMSLGGGKALDIRDLNPLSIFSSAPTAFTNPLIRAAAGAGAGLKVSNIGTGKSPELSRPPTVNQHGPLSASEALHFIEQQTPLGHARQSLTEKPVLRYDTGEPKFSGGKPVPKQPGQPYWQHLLGNPVVPQATTSPQLQRKLNATAKSKSKAAQKYIKQRQRSGL